MSQHSYVNHEALEKRAKRLAYKKAAEDCLGDSAFSGTSRKPSDDEMEPGKYYMDGKAYDSMEDLMIKGFTQDEKDIMLGNNPFVKVRY